MVYCFLGLPVSLSFACWISRCCFFFSCILFSFSAGASQKTSSEYFPKPLSLTEFLLAQPRQSSSSDVMGIVVHAFPAQDVYMEGTMRHGRDYVIVDHSKRPILLTLWEDFESIEGCVIDEAMPTMPIIIAMRVRVLTENYISLSTQPSSVILVAPDVLEARELDCWCERNVSKLVHMIFDNKSYTDSAILLPPVRVPTLTAISSVASFTRFDRATVWIKGRVEIACPMTRFWHLACPHCYHPYDFSTTLGIWCLSCGLGMSIFPRFIPCLVLVSCFGSN
ncbi:replication protein A 70 kDa DNA-binding subunit B-like isoform X10 [Coffea arabica]|uniref:Replication protein A 70 kDa DNA-binding subunit B-like isoform X10 n=1 Tax=Coffea arabica TaxID=13443 RepID=A0ABM4VVJ5_COFAR